MLKSVLAAAAAAALCATALQAQASEDVVTYQTQSSIEDAAFDLREAIINRGLVIDYESHLGAMLARTAADVGSSVVLFDDARVYLFCSAALSRAAMEADIAAISRCPYGVFVYQQPGDAGATVGYRQLAPEGAPADHPLQAIEALLDSIAKEAAGVE